MPIRCTFSCDPSGVACGSPADPNCDPSWCGYQFTPPIGWDPCATLEPDPVSYCQCEATVTARGAGAPAPAPLGVNVWDQTWQNYRGPTSIGQIPGATLTLGGVGLALAVIALIALAPVLGLVHH